MKRFFKSVFGASSKEVNGVIVLIVIFFLSLAYPSIHRYFSSELEPVSAKEAARLDSLVALLSQPGDTETPRELFSFDPNKASREDLLRLGFDERTTNQIIKYRNKGGHFNTRQDIYRIYAIDSSFLGLHLGILLSFQPTNH